MDIRFDIFCEMQEDKDDRKVNAVPLFNWA